MFSRAAYAVVAGAVVAGLASAAAAETKKITLTVAAGQATRAMKPLAMVGEYFIPEVNKRVKAANLPIEIEWKEAYAGSLLQPLQMLIALTGENFEALHESRVMIEGAIGRLLADKIDDPTLARLRKVVSIQAGLTQDPIAFRVSDTQFHRTLGAATSNPFLERISEALFVLGMEYRKIEFETPEVLARSVKDHRAIVAALGTRDGAKSEAAMVRHMQTVHETTRAARAAWDTQDG